MKGHEFFDEATRGVNIIVVDYLSSIQKNKLAANSELFAHRLAAEPYVLWLEAQPVSSGFVQVDL